MNSQNDKLQFKEWNTNEIQEWLTNEDYVYDNLVLETSNQIKLLWPELDKCCIINVDYDHIKNGNIDKFIKENEITLECLRETLIIPWKKGGDTFFKLKSLKDPDCQIKHIFGIHNFNACLILLKSFVKSCCKSASIFKIQEYYDSISYFKQKIEGRYMKSKQTYQNIINKNEFYVQEMTYLSYISDTFLDIDEYFKKLLSLIQNIINEITAENEKKKFNKVFKQNKWLGICSIGVAAAGAIAAVIVAIFT